MGKDVKKILVVDDEEKIVDVVKSYLEHSGFKVYVAYNGKKALELSGEIKPSLVILDLMLPDFTGEEVCRLLRKESRVPIIMLTAKVEEESILKGLDIGADDYVTKPFSPKQLVARVIALLRRASQEPVFLSSVVSYNNDELVIDNLKYEVRKKGDLINLTPNEYKLLMTFVKYPKKTFTREELVALAMGEDYDGYDRTIDVHIKNLRQKLENEPKDPRYIITVHGIGYKFGGDSYES
jgi:DNA-binding response OmpR family regulator